MQGGGRSRWATGDASTPDGPLMDKSDAIAAARAAIAKMSAPPQATMCYSAAPTTSATPAAPAGRLWPEPPGGFVAYNWPVPTGIHPDKEGRHASRIGNALRSRPNLIRHDIVLPDSDLCKKLVGPGGEHHRALCERSGVNMFVLNELGGPPDMPPNTRLVVLIGERNQVAQAIFEVEAATQRHTRGAKDTPAVHPDDRASKTAPPDSTATDDEPPVPDGYKRGAYLVPNSGMGALIGPAGRKINELRQESGCVIKVMQAPVPDEPSMRKLVVVAPTQDAIDKLRTMLKEALGREDSKRLRAEGEAPPKAEPKRLTASSLTFVPFERGSEQAQDAPVRSAPGDDAMKRDRRGRRVITVGEGEGAQELAVFFTEVRRARNLCHVIASPCSKRASPCALPLPYG